MLEMSTDHDGHHTLDKMHNKEIIAIVTSNSKCIYCMHGQKCMTILSSIERFAVMSKTDNALNRQCSYCSSSLDQHTLGRVLLATTN